MKLLHLTFHLGCQLDIDYIFKNLGHEIESMKFNDGVTDPNSTPFVQTKMYEVTHERAQRCWEKYKDYFNTFDGIITSDTCPTSRTFLQNNWPKLLIIWICNRFDYAIQPEHIDPEFYQLMRSIPQRKNVYIFGNATIENIYAKQVKNVDVGNFIIKPLGKNRTSEFMYKTYSDDEPDVFYVPPYQNETVLLNLSDKLISLGIQNKCERFQEHISELLGYKGVVYIPYAWSTIVFFERLQLGLVAFIPTERFLIELFKKGKYWFQPPFNINQPEMLKLSEWYTEDHRDLFVYFDSWDDLVIKVKTTDYKAKTARILELAKIHEVETMSRWASIINDYQTNFNLTNPTPVLELAAKKSSVVYENNVTIVLPCSVTRHSKVLERKFDGQHNPDERKESFLKSIRSWLKYTDLKILVIENSGYTFPELAEEKETYRERFEMVLYNQNDLPEASYLKEDKSQGHHEMFSILYGCKQSRLVKSSKFVIKITGRFFIPNFEDFLSGYDLTQYKALRQNRHLNCQIVGCHVDEIPMIFNKRCFYRDELAHCQNDYVEILWKERIDSFPEDKIITCPVFMIEATTAGCGGIVKSL